MEDEKPTGEQQAPAWEYRKNFHVTDRLKDVVGLTIDASKAEIARLRKRIDKLTYGG